MARRYKRKSMRHHGQRQRFKAPSAGQIAFHHHVRQRTADREVFHKDGLRKKSSNGARHDQDRSTRSHCFHIVEQRRVCAYHHADNDVQLHGRLPLNLWRPRSNPDGHHASVHMRLQSNFRSSRSRSVIASEAIQNRRCAFRPRSAGLLRCRSQ
jgi:hypothetical protein